jgi:hypothetical protein
MAAVVDTAPPFVPEGGFFVHGAGKGRSVGSVEALIGISQENIIFYYCIK